MRNFSGLKNPWIAYLFMVVLGLGLVFVIPVQEMVEQNSVAEQKID